MDWALLADQPLSQKLISKWFRAYFFMFIVAPTWYLIKVIVSNTLSVEDVGIFYSIMWFVILISLYNDMWLTESLQYFIPKYWIEKKYDYYKTIIYLTWIIQFVTWILIWWLLFRWSDWLALHHFHSTAAWPVIKILAFYFIGINLYQVLVSIFYAFQDVKRHWLTETVRLWGILILTTILFYSWNLDINNFSIIWLIWLGMGIIFWLIIFMSKYWYTLRYGKLSVQKNLLKTQFHYAFWVFLAANIGTLLWQLDQQIVVNLLWAKQAWYYTIFLTIVLAYSIIVSPLIWFLFPIVTELITKKDNIKLSMMLNIFYKYFSILAFSVWVLFLVMGPEIAYILFGIKFIYSGNLLSFTWLFVIFNVLFTINYGILAWLGKIKERVKILWWALLVNVILNILLLYVLKIWLIWAVIALVIGWFILWWRSYIVVNNNVKIVFDRKYLIKNITVMWIISLVIFYTKDLFFMPYDQYRYKNFGLLVVTIIVFYWVLWAFNYRNIKNLVDEVKKLKG